LQPPKNTREAIRPGKSRRLVPWKPLMGIEIRLGKQFTAENTEFAEKTKF
jgi:hypothetical protein